MERRLRQPPEGRAVSCPFSLPRIGNAVPLFLRESVWLPSERRLAGGQQVQGQVRRESSEGRRATGATRSWFGSRQRAAEGWAPCSGDDPGVHRSAALRRGSRCSRELLPSPGGRTRPHCATCAARVCPGTIAAPWTRSPGSQGWRPENAFPRLTCHHGQRHQREALERDGAGVRKKPAPRADAGAGAGGPRRRALQETSRSALRATVTTDGAASVAPTGPKAAASPSPSP